MEVTLYWIILVFLVVEFALERWLEGLNRRAMSPRLPDALRGIYDEAEYARFLAYKRDGGRLDAWSSGVTFAVTLVFLAAEVVTLFAYSFLWQHVLRRMPLSFAYSNKGVCTLWTALAGVLVIGEPFSWGKAAGLVVALAGVTLVVTDHE